MSETIASPVTGHEASVRKSVLEVSDSHPLLKTAIATLSDEQHQLFDQLARAEHNAKPTMGEIDESSLLAMMKTDTPLGRVAFGIWLGSVRVGQWARSCGIEDVQRIPSMIMSHPHLKDIGTPAYLETGYHQLRGMLGIQEYHEERPVARGARDMLVADPRRASELLPILSDRYKSKALLAPLLDNPDLADSAAAALLNFPLNPHDLKRDFVFCQRIIGSLPAHTEKAQQRLDALFAAAIKDKVVLDANFLLDLMNNHEAYREEAFALAAMHKVDRSDNRGGYLFLQFMSNPPTPEIRLKVADHVIKGAGFDWQHYDLCVYVFQNIPERRKEALAVLERGKHRKYMMQLVQTVPECASSILDTIERWDSEHAADVERQEAERARKDKERAGSGRRDWHSVLDSTNANQYFNLVTEAMRTSEDPEIANRLAQYLMNTVGADHMVGTSNMDHQQWRYRDVVLTTGDTVANSNRAVAFQKLRTAEFYNPHHLPESLFQVAQAKISPFSNDAATLLLERYGTPANGNRGSHLDIPKLKILLALGDVLSPSNRVTIGRIILADKTAPNSDIGYVLSQVPGLAPEVTAAIRPFYNETVARLRATLGDTVTLGPTMVINAVASEGAEASASVADAVHEQRPEEINE